MIVSITDQYNHTWIGSTKKLDRFICKYRGKGDLMPGDHTIKVLEEVYKPEDFDLLNNDYNIIQERKDRLKMRLNFYRKRILDIK